MTSDTLSPTTMTDRPVFVRRMSSKKLLLVDKDKIPVFDLPLVNRRDLLLRRHSHACLKYTQNDNDELQDGDTVASSESSTIFESHEDGGSMVASIAAKFNGSASNSTTRSWNDSIHSFQTWKGDDHDSEDSNSAGDDMLSVPPRDRRAVMAGAKALSFSSSYRQIETSGNGHSYTRTSSRGSLLLLDDTKLAQTQVIQSKLNKAARIVQQFYRNAHSILKKFRDEIQEAQSEKMDCERRRREELAAIQQELELEKQEIKKMFLEKEDIAETNDSPEIIELLNQELQFEKQRHESLKILIEDLKEENKKLSKQQTVDPVEDQCLRALRQKVTEMEQENIHSKSLHKQYERSIYDTQAKIDRYRRVKEVRRVQRKRAESSIEVVIQKVENSWRREHEPKLYSELIKNIAEIKLRNDEELKPKRSRRRSSSNRNVQAPQHVLASRRRTSEKNLFPGEKEDAFHYDWSKHRRSSVQHRRASKKMTRSASAPKLLQ